MERHKYQSMTFKDIVFYLISFSLSFNEAIINNLRKISYMVVLFKGTLLNRMNAVSKERFDPSRNVDVCSQLRRKDEPTRPLQSKGYAQDDAIFRLFKPISSSTPNTDVKTAETTPLERCKKNPGISAPFNDDVRRGLFIFRSQRNYLMKHEGIFALENQPPLFMQQKFSYLNVKGRRGLR